MILNVYNISTGDFHLLNINGIRYKIVTIFSTHESGRN
jgi:hypothetical protein